MASFDIFLKEVLSIEGGYQANRNDTGNYNSMGQLVGTKLGIAAKTLEAYYGRIVSKQDMMNLTKKTAADIYKKYYWDSINAGNIASQSVANLIADHAVNANPIKASRLTHRVLNLTKIKIKLIFNTLNHNLHPKNTLVVCVYNF